MTDDDIKAITCPGCGVLAHITTGLPVFVTFSANGCATVGVDTSELTDFESEELVIDHKEGCPEVTDDGVLELDMREPMYRLLEHVVALAAPEVDVSLPA